MTEMLEKKAQNTGGTIEIARAAREVGADCEYIDPEAEEQEYIGKHSFFKPRNNGNSFYG